MAPEINIIRLKLFLSKIAEIIIKRGSRDEMKIKNDNVLSITETSPGATNSEVCTAQKKQVLPVFTCDELPWIKSNTHAIIKKRCSMCQVC